MASLLCTSEDRIGLYLYDTRIGPTETPQSKSLKLADIIGMYRCVVHVGEEKEMMNF